MEGGIKIFLDALVSLKQQTLSRATGFFNLVKRILFLFLADCNDPGIPFNGQRRGKDFTLKNKVFFTCDRGYMRVGPEYLQCQSNRRWSDKAPTCERKTSVP